ncbi:MAG TPA: alpha/beta hydrolase [Ktedonobacteraceae bacterium]|nr:alpha/beta hydrolase [Ktedonobacteraceae bacterium]
MVQLQHVRLFRPRLKRIVIGGLGGSIGLIGILFAVAVYVVESLTRPRKSSPFDNYTFSPYELGLPAEAVTFSPLSGDHKVRGWYIPDAEATTTILVCPGYRSGISDVLGISAHLWKAGHNVLAFEYYGHGAEVGTQVTLGYREINDFLGAVAYAKERAPQTRLGVVAYSMGAAVAIMAAARNEDVEAIVADSAFATQWGVVDYNFRRAVRVPSAPFTWVADYLLGWRAGYHFHQVEPLRDIARIAPRPILIIHGGKDSIVSPADASLLYSAAGEPKELWFEPGADHCGVYFQDRIAYVKKVTEFFDLYLKHSRPHLQLIESSTEQQTPLADEQDGNSGLSEAS